MSKIRRVLGEIVRQCVPMAISILTISASAALAFSGLASLRGSPGNFTTELIGTIVHSVAHFIAHGDELVESMWLLQAPIALITYLLITAIPVAVGLAAMEAWTHYREKMRAVDATTAT
jgi:hypothetical protein